MESMKLRISKPIGALLSMALSIAMLIPGAISAQEAAKPTGEPIVIGVGAPLTGRSAAFGVLLPLWLSIAELPLRAP